MNIERCCESRGLFYDPYRKRCWRHATDVEHALVDELDERGKAVGLKTNPERTRDRLFWPYGPNIDVQSRSRMLAWAETYELRLTTRPRRCLHWLRKGRCAVSECNDWRAGWYDHVTTWNRDGKPAILVAQPYSLGAEDKEHLAHLNADPDLEVEISGDTWYGHGTTFVGIWRAEAFLDLAGAAEVIAEAREDAADQVLFLKK